jgi:hypothetical protein
MKKLFHVLVLVLAVHFLAAAGGVGWLFRGRGVSSTRTKSRRYRREMLFPTTRPPRRRARPPAATASRLLRRPA